jgi:hypothetical protein
MKLYESFCRWINKARKQQKQIEEKPIARLRLKKPPYTRCPLNWLLASP